MTFDYSKLRGLIKERYGTEQRFAIACDVTTTTMSLWLSGKTNLRRNNIMKMATALKLHPEDIGIFFFRESSQTLANYADIRTN